ncbi:MAG: RagB/SusD family nutrient uptake outer membrane protein [Bacteroidota bacterium]
MEVKNKIYKSIIVLMILLSSCDNFVDIDPPTVEVVSETVFSSEASAEAALIGIYSDLSTRNLSLAAGGATLYLGLSADEFVDFSNNDRNLEFFENAIFPDNAAVLSDLWSNTYSLIYSANSVLEGVENSSLEDEELKRLLTGEALFLRAFFHFYLVNLFGDVPYVTSTNFEINNASIRQSTDQVYESIIEDLVQARDALMDNDRLLDESGIRPNSYAVSSLLARVYLYTEDWTNAEVYATEVIEESGLAIEENLEQVFLPTSNETIWQLQTLNGFTYDADNFITEEESTPTSVALSGSLINSFESEDERFDFWIGSVTVDTETLFFPLKYRNNGSGLEENYVMLRLSEQYLIRSESRVRMDDFQGALNDLNVIRGRAGLMNNSAVSQEALLLAIEQERQNEFFAEFGHRWLDLKRTNRTDSLLGSIKADWQSTDALYPIPQLQLDRNPNFTQNPGY